MTDTQFDDVGTNRSSPEQARDEAATLGQDARRKAEDLRDEATERAHAAATDAKDGMADEISSIGRAFRRASDELREGSPQERTFGQLASTLADFSDTMRDKDLGEMVDDLSDFARRNPVAFLGGAALLGFSGVRLAKASQRGRAAGQRGEPYVRDARRSAQYDPASPPPGQDHRSDFGPAPDAVNPGTPDAPMTGHDIHEESK